MQDTTLFNTTVYNNLFRCIPDEELEALWEEWVQERIRNVLHLAQADFVFSLPQGRDTVIGERGLKLSWGEKQRIALARLLLKNPEMIVLDEATSALDVKTEYNIKQVIDDLFADKTMLVIAHRLSTIQSADEIVVLQEWRIVEQGTYEDLMKQQGYLYKMANPEHEFLM